MRDQELVNALRRLKVEIGSLACLGCGHEHNWRETYQRGVPGAKWGIWNCSRKEFQFDISEDTPMLAVARLYQKIGDDAKKWRFEPRQLPTKYIAFSSGS